MRELSRVLKESMTPIRRELLNLKKIGFLKDVHLANLIYYQVNKDFILFDELSSIVKKTLKEEIKL